MAWLLTLFEELALDSLEVGVGASVLLLIRLPLVGVGLLLVAAAVVETLLLGLGEGSLPGSGHFDSAGIDGLERVRY